MMKDNVYTIAAHLPFADTLAAFVMEKWGADPLVLSRVQILLPSRRACLALRDAFARQAKGQTLLLPRMSPLGDVDEDMLMAAGWPEPGGAALSAPPPGFAMKRLFILARLIQSYQQRVSGKAQLLEHAVRLAVELARLLDEMERENVSLDGITALVPDEFAAHWQITVDFLHILSQHWPQIAQEEGLTSPEAFRNQRIASLTQYWQAHPPATAVIAAGTTGSIPATAGLLAAITKLAQGYVVLPGLDMQASEDYFTHIGECHPQFGMRQLLGRLKLSRRDIIPIGEAYNARTQLLSEVMRPAETSQAWQQITLNSDEALTGLRRVDCADMQQEACVIALMLREALETDKTAALVTPDRALACSVAAQMQRYGITVDDSAGSPLAQTPSASYLRLVLNAAENSIAPLPLLALLKHPLTHAGMERIACLEAARILEVKLLRGNIPQTSFAGIRAALTLKKNILPDVYTLLDNLEAGFAPLMALFAHRTVPLAQLYEMHLQCARALAGPDAWHGPESEALADFLSDLQISCQSGVGQGTSLEPGSYLSLFETLLEGCIFRPVYGAHPQLKILSPIEARMQPFDRIILGSLNEGSWPPEPENDPWFNRPMRSSLGLSAPERRIGLAAHDFYMLASAPEVFLTRAGKKDGVPTAPSRWLSKLEVLLDGFPPAGTWEDTRWKQWAASLDSAGEVTPCAPPRPAPPLSARPRELSVTQVETLLRDPYAIYVAKILGLRPLKPIGYVLSGADFGSAVHQAMEHFVRTYPAALPEDAYDRLLAFGQQALAPLFFNATAQAWWWPRFVRIAGWVIEEERARRPQLHKVWTEKEGSYVAGKVTFTGRADRIEQDKAGNLRIIDYKTGTLPKGKDIEEGISSQLILLALIATQGKMELDGHNEVTQLEYWRLQGGRNVAEIKPVAEGEIEAFIAIAQKGLQELVEKYSDPSFSYFSTPIPSRASAYNDYEHLARVKEWS